MKIPVKMMKRQAIDGGNIFANQVSNRGLVFRIYKELVEFNSIKRISNWKIDKRHDHTVH